MNSKGFKVFSWFDFKKWVTVKKLLTKKFYAPNIFLMKYFMDKQFSIYLEFIETQSVWIILLNSDINATTKQKQFNGNLINLVLYLLKI